MPEPIDDEAVVELANTLAGLRRELAALGIEVSTVVDVDPAQAFGPWQAVVDAVRAGVAALDDAAAGSILERTVPVVDRLQGVLPVAGAAALTVDRGEAVDAALAAAVEDAAALATRLAGGDPDLLVAVEAAFAAALAASYVTWVSRDLLDATTVATGAGLVDVCLRPRGALARVYAVDSGAVVLDVVSSMGAGAWHTLAAAAVDRSDEERVASVHLRSHAAVAGLGGAEATVIATMAPEEVEPSAAHDAALVIGDAALADVALEADAIDAATHALARRAWERARESH
jgi:hypothetical protein